MQFSYTTNLDHFGDHLRPATYIFTIEAQNIVGIGAKSDYLYLTIPYLSENNKAQISGTGIADEIYGAVTAYVLIEAKDEEDNLPMVT